MKTNENPEKKWLLFLNILICRFIFYYQILWMCLCTFYIVLQELMMEQLQLGRPLSLFPFLFSFSFLFRGIIMFIRLCVQTRVCPN